jgi:hypothetical protein
VPGPEVLDETWHWVDPVAGAAKAAQALRPAGRLALLWNAFQPPAELADAFGAVYRRVLPDLPIFSRAMPGLDAYSVICAKAADGMRAVDGFDDPKQWRFDWEQSYTRDEWLDQLPTFGGHSAFPPGKLDELLAGLGAAIDAVGGSFAMRYAAVVVTAARRRGLPREPQGPGGSRFDRPGDPLDGEAHVAEGHRLRSEHVRQSRPPDSAARPRPARTMSDALIRSNAKRRAGQCKDPRPRVPHQSVDSERRERLTSASMASARWTGAML